MGKGKAIISVRSSYSVKGRGGNCPPAPLFPPALYLSRHFPAPPHVVYNPRLDSISNSHPAIESPLDPVQNWECLLSFNLPFLSFKVQTIWFHSVVSVRNKTENLPFLIHFKQRPYRVVVDIDKLLFGQNICRRSKILMSICVQNLGKKPNGLNQRVYLLS